MTGLERLVRLGLLAGVAVSLVACGAAPPPVTAPRPVPAPAPESASPVPAAAASTPAVTEADLDALRARQLMVPVEGVSRRTLRDDFGAKRGERIHGALDILAPRLTAVLAPDDLVIGRLGTGALGGIFAYATDPSGQFVYYFAHLDRYRRGLAVGERVAKGGVIGYVGHTGNASPEAPHLHFQVMKRGARVWWDGPPINPVALFAYDGYRGTTTGDGENRWR